MAIRTTCPSCEASLSFDDEKGGKKVRCRKCDETFALPAAKTAKRKSAEDDAVQDSRTMKAKATRPRVKSAEDDAVQDSRTMKAKATRPRVQNDEDEDDDRPTKKKKNSKAAKKGMPLGLILGGVGAAAFLLLATVGGVTAFLLTRKPAPAPVVAKNEDGEKPPVEPEKKTEPTRKIEPGQNGDQLSPDVVARVKQATVYLSVRMGDGQKAEGSGFFCVEPGLVVTNAHVLGMMQAKAPPPQQIDVVLNSGLPNEITTNGNLVGVDRESDLAVLRVTVPNAPAPLPFGDQGSLFETQKVYISGFPLGRALGKDITISPSAVSSLRKDATGMLEQIQVNGGMSPGNSGGPVISSGGNLVGVAVAGIKGTQINFAIPGDFVKRLMDGRAGEVTTGTAFMQNGQTMLPVKVAAIDPLNKIRSMRIEVWTGNPGQPRPLSNLPPAPLAGDSPHQPQQLVYRTGSGSADITVPSAPPGQVYWLQPVITNAAGKTQWGVAVTASASSSSSSPLERKPADLTVNLTAQKERTINLKTTTSITVPENKIKHVLAVKVEADMLEVMNPDPKGSRIKTAVGAASSHIEIDGDKKPVSPRALDILRREAPAYTIDGTNRIFSKKILKLEPTMPADLKSQVELTHGQLSNAIQAVTIPMPNRVVQPGEKWNTSGPLIMGSGAKKVVVDLNLTCTYEGIRTRNQRSEGFISVTGVVQGRAKFKGQRPAAAEEVTGKVAFDLAGGFISFAQLKISSEGEQDTASLDIDLTRSPGNTGNLQLAQEKTPDPKNNPPAAGKTLIDSNLTLAPNAPPDPTLPKTKTSTSHMAQNGPVQMQAGKTYTITVNSTGFHNYVRVVAGNGIQVATGNNLRTTRLSVQCTVPGPYFIFVSSRNNITGQYQLTVTESP